MVLLCSRHHTAHHAGTYTIHMRHGIPWVRLPAWQNITQPWLRNTTHHHTQLATHTAHTLHGQQPLPLDLNPPPEQAT